MDAKTPSKKGSNANWLNKKFYEKEIKLLQEELVKLQKEEGKPEAQESDDHQL